MKNARFRGRQPILIAPPPTRYSGGMVYTMGDPGLGSFLKKAGGAIFNVAKTVGKAVLGVQEPPMLQLPPGYAGPVEPPTRPPTLTLPPQMTYPSAGGGGLPQIEIDPPFGGDPGASIRVGRTKVQTGGGAGMINVTRSGSRPGTGPVLKMTPSQDFQQAPPQGSVGGMRLNKSDYFLRDGTFVPRGSRWVKSRRRNPLNPRALDRAIGRISSAKKAAGRLGKITIRKSCD